jgi:HAD superfamily phosphatase
MDGVLVDVTESYREAIVHVVRHFTGKEVSRLTIQEYKNTGGYNNDWKLSHRLIAEFGVEVEYQTVVDYFNQIFLYSGNESLIHREQWIANDGLLERIGEKYDFAIYTGRLQVEADVTLKRYANGLRFDPVMCHDHVVQSKPHPEGLLKIAEMHLGRKIWYIGDTVDDARCGKAAGVDFIGIASPKAVGWEQLAALLKADGAVAVLDNINQLETVL